MRKAARIVGKILLGLVAIVVLVVAVSYPVSAMKLKKRYAMVDTPPAMPSDAARLPRGEVLANAFGCTGCHGEHLSGQVMVSAFPMGRFAAPNLTRGRGGISAAYTDADWERAIRHGIRPNGEHLVIMPVEVFNKFRDDELEALVAYVKSVPPVDTTQPKTTLWPLGRVLHVAGAPLVAAERIDHAAPHISPPPGPTREYGEFVGMACRACHGDDLAGRAAGESFPGSPASPNLTPAGDLGKWTEAQFVQTIRTGTTPAGWKLNPERMPYRNFAKLSDDELRAVWMYLQSVPAKR